MKDEDKNKKVEIHGKLLFENKKLINNIVYNKEKYSIYYK